MENRPNNNKEIISLSYYNSLRDTENLFNEIKKGVSCIVENRTGGYSSTGYFKYIISTDEQIKALIDTNNEWAEKVAERNNTVSGLLNKIGELESKTKPVEIKGFYKRLMFLINGKI